MNFEAMPKIRLEVEGMKHAIIAHIGARGSELGDMLEAEISRALEAYPWEKSVRDIVHNAMDEQLMAYFKYGDGARAVKEAVAEGFEAILESSKEEL